MLGSQSGTSPGLPLGNVTLPLNIDNYTVLMLIAPNQGPVSGAFGLLDGQGRSQASFDLGVGQADDLIGLTIHHAYIVLDLQSMTDPFPFASQAVPLTLAP